MKFFEEFPFEHKNKKWNKAVFTSDSRGTNIIFEKNNFITFIINTTGAMKNALEVVVSTDIFRKLRARQKLSKQEQVELMLTNRQLFGIVMSYLGHTETNDEE